jgi:sugar lactone lactonase YvrE
MQLANEKNTTSLARAAVAILVVLLAAFAWLVGCSSSSNLRTTRFLLVSDSGNNRVLFYNFPFSTNESASGVLGQGEFMTSGTGLTPETFNEPVNAAQDAFGNIYVSDLNQNRVLQFRPPFPVPNDENASLVIGQPDFITGAPNDTQNGLTEPGGLAFDHFGNLWVVDFGNNRILEYAPPFTTHMNATLVLGQATFTSNAAATTNSGLTSPHLIAVDASGDLWVTDSGNNRLLEFKPPFANGMAASVVIGQADFVSGGAATTATGLSFPTGIAFDSSGNLWIGDTDNNRVLQFKPPFASGMSASLVLGEADFTTSTAATTQSGFSGPFGIAFDSSGNLWVADSGNNRTLEFTPPFSTNQNASLVLGQADFTSNAGVTSATGQHQPLAVSAGF